MQRTTALLIIGGCELSRERNPICSIEQVSLKNIDGKVQLDSNVCGKLLEARRSPSIFLSNGCVTVAGGCTGENFHSSSVERLYNNNATWLSTFVDSTVKAHSCAAHLVFKGQQLVLGGFTTHESLSDVQIITDKEAKIVKAPCFPRLKNAVAVGSDDEVIVFGGWEDERRTSNVVRRLKFSDDFDQCQVEFVTFLPSEIEGHSSAQIENLVFLTGGFDGFSVTDGIVVYDLETHKNQISETKLKIARENHVSGIVHVADTAYLVVAGGWDGKKTLDSVEVFQISQNAPYLKPEITGSLVIPRNRPSSISI